MVLLRTLFLFAAVASVGCAPKPASRGIATRDAAGTAPDRDDRALVETFAAHRWACSLTDEVGPRLAGSPGDAAAIAWGLRTMKELGLANVRAEPVTVPVWQRGAESGEIVAPFRHALSLAALGGSVSTPEGGIEAEVVRVESIAALQALPDDAVKGRIVFYDKKMERLPSGEGYGKTVDVRVIGAIEAAKKGAVASVVRTVGTSGARFPHTGAMRASPDGIPKIPAAALAIPDAELVARLIARDAAKPVRIRLVLASKQLPDAQSANVIGEVTGRELPDEIVLLGAHLDSWDVGTGAVDDAAGVGAILEIGRQLAMDPPRRTVRIVLFANEENGLRGAKEYARVHADEAARHVAAMEMDSGAGRADGVLYSAGPGADGDALMAALTPALRKLGLPAPRRVEDAAGADTSQLVPLGVPQVGVDQDRSRYFDLHHSADDTCDKIIPAELAHATAAALEVTRALANARTTLPRLPPSPKK